MYNGGHSRFWAYLVIFHAIHSFRLKPNTKPFFDYSGLYDAGPAPDSFIFEIDKYQDLRSIRFSDTVISSSLSLPIDLEKDSVFYWRVIACESGACDDTSRVFAVHVVDPVIGDADGSGFVDIDDVVYLINYIFAGGPVPMPALCCGAMQTAAAL